MARAQKIVTIKSQFFHACQPCEGILEIYSHFTANLSVVIFLVFIRVPVPAVVQLYSLALSDVLKEQL